MRFRESQVKVDSFVMFFVKSVQETQSGDNWSSTQMIN